MSNQYLVTTPRNLEYSGKTFGVLFQGGRALVSEFTIDPTLGYTVEQIVKKMKEDFGYTVEQVGDKGQPETKPSGKKRGKAKAAAALEVTESGT